MKIPDTDSHIFGQDDRTVFRIIVYCLSLAFSVLVASLETLRSTDTGFTFVISWRTLLALVVGGVIFVPCFKTSFLSPSKRRRTVAIALAVVTGFVSFLYPLRFVPAHKLGAIFTGLTIAACVLSTIGGILFVIKRSLDADERRTALEQASGKLSSVAIEP